MNEKQFRKVLELIKIANEESLISDDETTERIDNIFREVLTDEQFESYQLDDVSFIDECVSLDTIRDYEAGIYYEVPKGVL